MFLGSHLHGVASAGVALVIEFQVLIRKPKNCLDNIIHVIDTTYNINILLLM